MDLDSFKQEQKRIQKQATIATIISVITGLSILGFGVWVVLKVMAHFGII